jgi:hypothetical protein
MSEIEKKQSDENIINKENIKEEVENEDEDDDLKNFKNLINIECNKLKSLSNEIIDIYKVIQKKRQRINELYNNLKNDDNNIKNNNDKEIASGKIIETLSAKKNKFFKSYKLIINYKKQQCIFGPYKSKKFLKIFKTNIIEELKKINIKNNNNNSNNNNNNNDNKDFIEPTQEQKNSIKKCFQELKEQIEILYPPLDEYQKIVKNHKNEEDIEIDIKSFDESNKS